MLVTRQSIFTGIERTVDLPITEDQYERWRNGELVQNAFPQLNADEREFLMTGCTPEEWDEMFGEEE